MTQKKIELQVKNLSKKFNIGFKKNFSLLARVLAFSGREAKREKQVLDNVSFNVFKGETMGVIGRNGSGKSTLLGLIAGIYEADKGEIISSGKISYLSGWGFGLQHRLTMRDNIYLSGSILGLGKKDIADKFDEIVKFSGLEEFPDTKIYQFSSGMITRLAFSIVAHCLEYKKPDILLLDEVFGSGGDIDFQNNALKKMESLISGGITVIMVSHNLGLIKQHCKRAVWLDNGKVVSIGNPEIVVNNYIKENEIK